MAEAGWTVHVLPSQTQVLSSSSPFEAIPPNRTTLELSAS